MFRLMSPVSKDESGHGTLPFPSDNLFKKQSFPCLLRDVRQVWLSLHQLLTHNVDLKMT